MPKTTNSPLGLSVLWTEYETSEGRKGHNITTTGQYKGHDLRVNWTPTDKGGWSLLSLVFLDSNTAELIVEPTFKDEKTGRQFYAYYARSADEEGNELKVRILPKNDSDKDALASLIH